MVPHALGLLCSILLLPQPERPSRARLRFPPQEVCRAALDFNIAYQEYCRCQRDNEIRLERVPLWVEALADAESAYAAWWCLTLVACDHPRVDVDPEGFWSDWLGSLRCRIGDEAYFAGRMP